MLRLVRRGDKAAEKLFDMGSSEMLNRHVVPGERIVANDPQLKKLFGVVGSREIENS
jgi:hypothetical protein